MFEANDDDEYNFCNECKQEFEDSFELIDHVLEDDEEFDPYYLLPNGFKLHLGSLLRYFFAHADNPEQIKLLTQSTYVTLFAAENGYDLMDELVEDMVVKSAMQDLDKNIEKLLSKDTDEEGEE
jgi:hypothetical protein